MSDDTRDESIRAASLAHAQDVRLIVARRRPPRWAVRCTDCGREFAAATPRPAQQFCPECSCARPTVHSGGQFAHDADDLPPAS